MGTSKTFAPTAYLAASVANVYTPPSSAITSTIRLIHVANVTGAPATFTLYRGATGGSTGGTELAKGKVVPANDYVLMPLAMEMASTDFLSGLASAGSTLTITVMGDQRVI